MTGLARDMEKWVAVADGVYEMGPRLCPRNNGIDEAGLRVCRLAQQPQGFELAGRSRRFTTSSAFAQLYAGSEMSGFIGSLRKEYSV